MRRASLGISEGTPYFLLSFRPSYRQTPERLFLERSIGEKSELNGERSAGFVLLLYFDCCTMTMRELLKEILN